MRLILAILATATVLLGGTTVAFAAGDGTFTPAGASPFGAGSTPASIATADFDQDGDLDLAVANRDSGDVTVLVGDGTGSFTPAATITLTTDARPVSIVAGKFNGDADPDLAVSEPGKNLVAILTGGAGTTFTSTTVPVVQAPTRLAIADFNRDNNQDLAVITSQNSRVSILKGAGNSTFPGPAASTTTAGDSPSALAVGDFNDDGAPDVAVTSLLLNTVTVLIGDGAGGMTRQPDQPTTGTSPLGIVAADFNGDGDPDLATANSVSDNVSIFAGQPGPGFAAGATTAAGDGPSAIVTADLNGDSEPDLAVTNQAPGAPAGSVSSLLGGAGITFAPVSGSPFAVGAEPLALTAGDFNGDAIQDVATADGGADSVSVLLGNAASSPPPPGGGDNKPPETTIDKGPSGKTDKTKAKIRYSANEAATFECRLKGKGVDQGDGRFFPCGQTKIKFKHLAPGKKKFQVRATDVAGNTDPTPAKIKWKIVR